MNELRAISGDKSGATPMMSQYLEIKAANPGCLLFYRMGDFYELFFEDAEIASRALGIALTKRGKHLGNDIPMCGVPAHAADEYLQRLIRLGHRVAICEQLEDPAEAKKRGYKEVVRRDVVRLVTPGTLTEDTLLDSRRNNYLAALARVRGDGDLALAWADISSGELAVILIEPARLAADLARLEPGEVVLPDILIGEDNIAAAIESCGAALTPLPSSRFDSIPAERRLKQHFSVEALDAFGDFSRAEIASLGGLLDYIVLTQVGRVPALRPPRREDCDGAMLIDTATRSNLELTRTLSGERSGSLQSVIDMTRTAGGSRLLANRLANPLTHAAAINQRLDEITYFVDARELRRQVCEHLVAMPDLERALARISLGRCGPRDLASIRDGLMQAAKLSLILKERNALNVPPVSIETIAATLADIPAGLGRDLNQALNDDLPILSRDGGFIRAGFLAELDDNRKLRDETRKVIAGLQATYAELTGIKSLKVRHNNILGYYIEVSSQSASVLQSATNAGTFIHRQTMAGAMRFTTTELASLEQRIAAAADRALAIELEIFTGLTGAVKQESMRISAIAAAVAALDVAASLAELAEKRRYVRPMVDSSTSLVIRDGRHPVVEAALEKTAKGSFVANACDLSTDQRRLWLLTGPNMAGKSTFLRQNALIVILAQMGCFVPAAEAHIGIVDRLFSRVGAADDLARGRSTFMVEMVETAAILNQATERSFVILDEIGRGTSTFDGLSIAWAAVEHLHDVNRCRGLFATHYHELTALSSRLDHISNATVKVREWQGEVIFLHEVVPGAADRSYGIQVAKLAGLPRTVTQRAGEVLTMLEKNEQSAARKSLIDDLPLFSVTPKQSSPAPGPSELERRLSQVAADELTPRQALELIYELKSLLK